MKSLRIVALVSLFLLGALSIHAEEAETPVVEKAEVKTAADSAKVVTAEKPSALGSWIVVASDYILEGDLTLNADGSYEKTEMHKDSVRATVKGKYSFDDSKEPFAIDICLGECGAPGSEWTTTFGILRFLDSGRMEIRWSETGERPAKFAAEPDHNTVIYERLVVEEAVEE